MIFLKCSALLKHFTAEYFSASCKMKETKRKSDVIANFDVTLQLNVNVKKNKSFIYSTHKKKIFRGYSCTTRVTTKRMEVIHLVNSDF